jgi:hypothetical protein
VCKQPAVAGDVSRIEQAALRRQLKALLGKVSQLRHGLHALERVAKTHDRIARGTCHVLQVALRAAIKPAGRRDKAAAPDQVVIFHAGRNATEEAVHLVLRVTQLGAAANGIQRCQHAREGLRCIGIAGCCGWRNA